MSRSTAGHHRDDAALHTHNLSSETYLSPSPPPSPSYEVLSIRRHRSRDNSETTAVIEEDQSVETPSYEHPTTPDADHYSSEQEIHEEVLPLARADGSRPFRHQDRVIYAPHVQQVEDPPAVSTSASISHDHDTTSLVTTTLSHVTSPASTDRRSFMEPTPSPDTSEQNDAVDIEHTLVNLQHKEESNTDVDESIEHVPPVPHAIKESQDEFSPSRRSSRIDTSASSVQSALLRRDELDAILMGKRRGHTPISSLKQSSVIQQQLPARRPVGRPRKSLPVSTSISTSQSASSTSETPIKRGRGRPRKSAPATLASSGLATAYAALNTPSRRISGRVRTPSVVAAAKAAAMSPFSPVRKSYYTPTGNPIGRPRKVDVLSSTPKVTPTTPTATPTAPTATPAILKASSTALKTPQTLSIAAEIPVKRGRGRPRKSAPVILQSSQSANEMASQAGSGALETPVRRPVGRPRKSAPPMSGSLALPVTPVAHRLPSLRGERKSSRLSAASASPNKMGTTARALVPSKLASEAAVSPMVKKAETVNEALPTPPKRGRGRPRKSAPVASPQQEASISAFATPVAPWAPSVWPSRITQSQSIKRPASLAFPTEQGAPKKRRGRPPGPVRLRQIMEEERLAKARLASALAEGHTSETELSDATSSSTLMTVDGGSPEITDIVAKQSRYTKRQDKDRKTYYVAGLYAGVPAPLLKASDSAVPTPDSTMLPPPRHFGSQLLEEARDYALPFYLHQEHDNLLARVEARRKPAPYQLIKANKYTSRPKLPGEITVCSCKPPSNCGSDCMNLMTLFICDPKACPCGEACTNISLGKRQAIKTAVFYCGGRGFGLKTTEPIAAGQFVDEYRGEVINLTEMTKRVNEEYMATGNFYLLDYDAAAGELLDGGRKGNIVRFANHSCDPNCRMEKYTLCGTDESLSAEFQIGLFALRDIEAGEELTYNYGWSAFQPRDMNGVPTSEVPPMTCLCGSANCVGILGGKKMPPTKPGESSKSSAKVPVKKKRGRPKLLPPKAAASLLTKVTQTQNEAGNSALSRKVGVRQSRRTKVTTSVNLALKVKLKRRERMQTQGASSATTTANNVINATADAVPVKRGRGRPRKIVPAQVAATLPNQVVPTRPNPAASDDSLAQPTARILTAAPPPELRTPRTVDSSASLTSMLAAQASPNKINRGFKGLSYSAADAVVSDEDDWLNDSDSDDDESFDEPAASSQPNSASRTKAPRKRKPRKISTMFAPDDHVGIADRRARNAFLARVRRANKRGITIEGADHHPLKKVSIQCTAAPENTYIPDLPSSLVTLGMSTVEARRARNAFLARVRRGMKRGFSKVVAIEQAAKPLPGDRSCDTPIMHAQRAQLEQLQQEAAAELTADTTPVNLSIDDSADARSPTWEDMYN